ncbi:MAG: hypothetical protein ACQXXK_01220, partial [Methanothrix sp.]|uniref:hypothetical protein n=1 Tax=Methanothrix sp. TaxID=90426 RepID=UPI003D2A423C
SRTSARLDESGVDVTILFHLRQFFSPEISWSVMRESPRLLHEPSSKRGMIELGPIHPRRRLWPCPTPEGEDGIIVN